MGTLTGAGLACAAFEWGWAGPAGVLVAAAFVAAMMRGCFLAEPSLASIRRLVAFGLSCGAFVVAAAGLLAVLALPGGALVLAAALTHPRARRFLGSSAHPRASAVAVRAPDADEHRFEATPLPAVTPEGLDDAALCQAWRRSFLLLQTSRVDRVVRVVELRQQYLDELERRHPAGISRWLASGARAAGNPLPFLVDRDSST